MSLFSFFEVHGALQSRGLNRAKNIHFFKAMEGLLSNLKIPLQITPDLSDPCPYWQDLWGEQKIVPHFPAAEQS